MPEPHGSGMLLSATGLTRLLAMFGASDSVSDQDIAHPESTEGCGPGVAPGPQPYRHQGGGEDPYLRPSGRRILYAVSRSVISTVTMPFSSTM